MNDRSRPSDERWANIAAILILAGAILLIGEIFDVRLGADLWPLFILGPGIALLVLAFRGEEANSGLAVPGGVLTTLGLIFFYQTWTGHWESWAYAWALIPIGVAATLYAVGKRNSDEMSLHTARRTARFFGIIFIVGAVFFELLIFDRGGFSGYFLPIALVVVGGVMLWMQHNRTGSVPWVDDIFSRIQSSANVPDSTSESNDEASPPPAAATPPSAPARPKRAAASQRTTGSTNSRPKARSTRSGAGTASKPSSRRAGSAAKSSGAKSGSAAGSASKSDPTKSDEAATNPTTAAQRRSDASSNTPPSGDDD